MFPIVMALGAFVVYQALTFELDGSMWRRPPIQPLVFIEDNTFNPNSLPVEKTERLPNGKLRIFYHDGHVLDVFDRI